MKRMVSGCLAAALVLFAARPAGATPLITAALDNSLGSNLNNVIYPGASVTINTGDGSAPGVSYYPGVVHWNLVSNTTSYNLPQKFTTFCIDLPQDVVINSPPTNYQFTPTALQYRANASKSISHCPPRTSGYGSAISCMTQLLVNKQLTVSRAFALPFSTPRTITVISPRRWA
jgi:hypothetical protein